MIERRTRPPGITNSRKGAGWEFLRSVAAEEPDGLCRDWPYGTLKQGYGQIVMDGRTTSAHRAMLVLLTGENEPGMVARHTCDRPICVAPWHLLWGTQAENTQDAVSRGRMYQLLTGHPCGECSFIGNLGNLALHLKRTGHKEVMSNVL